MQFSKLVMWHLVNDVTPYVGLFIAGHIMFSSKYKTNSKITSTLVVNFALIWLGLLWADVGSLVFVPSRQTILARVLLLIAMLLVMLEVSSTTKKLNQFFRDC